MANQNNDSNSGRSGFQLLQEFSAFLLTGTVIALLWANFDNPGYHHLVHTPIFEKGHWLADLLTHGDQKLDLHFIVNDMFMVLFFGLAGKEVAESFLPGGSLSSVRKAALPVIATLGGVVGPVLLFIIICLITGVDTAVISGGWAIPTATDIAYCWLFAGLIFGRAHPAVVFLLVLAVIDDLIGMLIIAFYYTPEVHPQWLVLLVLALVVCEAMRRFGVKSFWPYLLIGGPLSWFGLHNTGVHPALALVPIMPFLPHAERDAGLFVESDEHDALDEFEHFFKPIVDVGLFGFGFANAGVALSTGSFAGAATWAIFLALLLGKTFGIFGFSWFGQKILKLELPKPMVLPQMIVLGCVAGIGFTVALFVTAVAISVKGIDPETGDMLKLGALLSFAAGPIAIFLGKKFKVEKIHS